MSGVDARLAALHRAFVEHERLVADSARGTLTAAEYGDLLWASRERVACELSSPLARPVEETPDA